jgi:hypothetical protein
MVKCLPRGSQELRILIELNHSERRQDPWNPAPHVRGIVERDSRVFVVMERLSAYDDPPFKTVANYVDLFRQMLEVRGTVFILLFHVLTPTSGLDLYARTQYRQTVISGLLVLYGRS